MEILTKYTLDIFFGLISAGALAFCKYMYNQMKNYKKLLEEKKKDRSVMSFNYRLS